MVFRQIGEGIWIGLDSRVPFRRLASPHVPLTTEPD